VVQPELIDHQSAQAFQKPSLVRGEIPRFDVQNAQRSEANTAPDGQWSSGIEPDVWLSHHETVSGESPVGTGIRHDEDLIMHDGVVAECLVARRLDCFADPKARLELLAMSINQGYEDHRHIEHLPRNVADPVDGRRRRCIENGQLMKR
jgi:hypothetical protein